MKINILLALICVGTVASQDVEQTDTQVEAATESEDAVVEETTNDQTTDDTQIENADEVTEVKKTPFQNPLMESIGTILMLILIALSNAGGLSGAGSNIPIMLIFFDLEMSEAVPISAFVAVCATLFRFTLNFN